MEIVKRSDESKYDKICAYCPCGIKVCGNSPEHLEANLRIHQKSILHKKQMQKKTKDKNKKFDWSIELSNRKRGQDDVKRLKQISDKMEKKFNPLGK